MENKALYIEVEVIFDQLIKVCPEPHLLYTHIDKIPLRGAPFIRCLLPTLLCIKRFQSRKTRAILSEADCFYDAAAR
jgi:hypothetical protein